MQNSDMREVYKNQIRVSEKGFKVAGIEAKNERQRRSLLALLTEVGELLSTTEGQWKWWSEVKEPSSLTADELVDVLLMVLLVAVEYEVSYDDLLEKASDKLVAVERKISEKE